MSFNPSLPKNGQPVSSSSALVRVLPEPPKSPPMIAPKPFVGRTISTSPEKTQNSISPENTVRDRSLSANPNKPLPPTPNEQTFNSRKINPPPTSKSLEQLNISPEEIIVRGRSMTLHQKPPTSMSPPTSVSPPSVGMGQRRATLENFKSVADALAVRQKSVKKGDNSIWGELIKTEYTFQSDLKTLMGLSNFFTPEKIDELVDTLSDDKENIRSALNMMLDQDALKKLYAMSERLIIKFEETQKTIESIFVVPQKQAKGVADFAEALNEINKSDFETFGNFAFALANFNVEGQTAFFDKLKAFFVEAIADPAILKIASAGPAAVFLPILQRAMRYPLLTVELVKFIDKIHEASKGSSVEQEISEHSKRVNTVLKELKISVEAYVNLGVKQREIENLLLKAQSENTSLIYEDKTLGIEESSFSDLKDGSKKIFSTIKGFIIRNPKDKYHDAVTFVLAFLNTRIHQASFLINSSPELSDFKEVVERLTSCKQIVQNLSSLKSMKTVLESHQKKISEIDEKIDAALGLIPRLQDSHFDNGKVGSRTGGIFDQSIILE